VTDAAIAAREPIDAFLRQKPDEVASAEEADAALTQLALLSSVAEPAPAPQAEPAPPPQPAAAGTPLHSAIPPLHLAA
jgi:flagellum-specific ATP synthase